MYGRLRKEMEQEMVREEEKAIKSTRRVIVSGEATNTRKLKEQEEEKRETSRSRQEIERQLQPGMVASRAHWREYFSQKELRGRGLLS